MSGPSFSHLRALRAAFYAILLGVWLGSAAIATAQEAGEGPRFGAAHLPALPPVSLLVIGEGPPLGLEEVLASVQRRHPSAEIARQRVRGAEGDRLAAEGGFDLNVRAQGWAAPQGYYDWARADLLLEQPTPFWGTSAYAGWRIGRGGDIPGYYGDYQTLEYGELRAGVRVPLWRDGPIDSRRARLWRSEHATEASRAELEGRMLELRLAASRAYWAWVAAGQRYRVAASLLELAERREGQIAVRVRAGAIPAIESLENRRVVVGRRAALISARRALEAAGIALSLYLRTGSGAPWVPSPARVPLSVRAPDPLRAPLEREIEAAWSRRPETERYRSLLRMQRITLDYAENRFAPRIDLAVEASVDLGDGSSTDQVRLGTPVVAGSLTVSLPLQLREARGGIDRARSDLASLQEEARLARDQIAAQVRDAHSAVRAAEENVELTRQAAEISEEVAEAERRRFELGSTQLLIVNLREQSAAAARASQIDAEAALEVAHARWLAATGLAVGDL